MSGRVCEAVKTEVRKIRIGKTEGRRKKRKERTKKKRKEKTKKEENNGIKEGSRGVGNLG